MLDYFYSRERQRTGHQQEWKREEGMGKIMKYHNLKRDAGHINRTNVAK